MEKLKLNNDITLICDKTENTPRVALSCFINIDKQEEVAGTYSILNRLFMQGTKKRSAEQIAHEIECNGLDIYSEMKSDYWKFSMQCLKEDFETAVELLSDIMLNSTFDNFDKEIIKMKGETIASLDSPTALARDKFVENLYKNHQYGNTGTVILEDIDKITQHGVKKAYENVFEQAEKVFSTVGDIDSYEVKKVLDKYFSNLKSIKSVSAMGKAELNEVKVVKVPKNDANQAQIYQGWFVPGLKSEDSAPLSILNTILGSSGLSSRLFLELRDKKGLAYTVRSIYNKMRCNGDFRVYIATEPKNIKVSLDGFKVEIDKVKNELVSETELANAKNNLIGKIQFVTETNLQKASMSGAYELEDLGYDYLPKWIDRLNKVTAKDVQRVARKYLNEKYVLTVLAPEKNLSEV